MTKFYLTRHGQTEWNVAKRMQGQHNSNLTDTGVRQAQALGKAIRDLKIDCIYSSSSQRTLDTANLIRGDRNLDIIPEDDLREIYLGTWEGLTFEEAEQSYPETFDNFWHHPEKYIPVDGETFEQVRTRTSNVLKKLAKQYPDKSILIVTHGVVLRTLYTFFRHVNIAESVKFEHPHSTCFCEVIYESSEWKVMKWNNTDHYKYLGEE